MVCHLVSKYHRFNSDFRCRAIYLCALKCTTVCVVKVCVCVCETMHILCLTRLISTEGYVVIDDSGHPQFSSSQWPWVVNQSFPHPSNESCTSVWLDRVSGQDLVRNENWLPVNWKAKFILLKVNLTDFFCWSTRNNWTNLQISTSQKLNYFQYYC